MMMPFICSCRNKKIALKPYTPPLGTSPHTKRKENKHMWWCYHHDPNGAMVILFPFSVNIVRYWYPTCYPSSAPIDQWFALMSHSISYNNVSHTRICVVTLTSPPPLPLSRPWTGWSTRWPLPSHLLMWGLLVPTSMSLLILPVSLDTYKNLTPGFLLLSSYLCL